MAIKIQKKNMDKKKEAVRYKSIKKILTPLDIYKADQFDNSLNKEIEEIEKIILKNKMLSPENKKSNTLSIWYLIGSRINKFLKNNKVTIEEEKIFWDNLYGRSSIIGSAVPISRISKTRNDFWIASILARHPLSKLRKIKLWSLWREIVTHKSFSDERVLNWILKKMEQFPPRTRNEARPFLKSISARLKKIDTTVLSDEELLVKLEEVKG